MGELPITRRRLPDAHQSAIRDAVRAATGIGFDDAPSRVAVPEDAGAFFRFLSDPEIHGAIYNLPRPLTVDTVRMFIVRKLDERAAGEGLLFLRFDTDGAVLGYSEFDIWPEWGAGDLGGALRRDQQGGRSGVNGAKRTFDWMFDGLGLELIVATGARDNVRTARMLDGLGFVRKGEIISTRQDGTTRPSRVWEISKAEWRKAHPSEA